MSDKITLTMEVISERISLLNLPNIELIIGIATGGVVPAALISYRTGKPLKIIKLNYRDEENTPIREEPELQSDDISIGGAKKILLVDDVSVSGKTLDAAKKLFAEIEITSLVMKGKADIVLFPELNKCVNWPWK